MANISASTTTNMKAIVYHEYGSPDVLQSVDLPLPVPKDDEVLIKVHATSLNSSDMELLTADQILSRLWGLFKPKFKILGSDIAGRVAALGKNVSQFQIGDEVFGDNFEAWGGLAEYVCMPAEKLLMKPTNMSFEQAAAIPQAGVVALQGLRDKGPILAGQKVLINGAGGGAGTFAIQIAKQYDAEVTGVDSARKFDLMRSLGADHVIDYQKEDFVKNGQQYDLILDVIARRSLFQVKQALSPTGKYVMAGGNTRNILQTGILGPLVSLLGKQKMGLLLHKQNHTDLQKMIQLFESGAVLPVIDQVFPLSDSAKAFQYLIDGKALGKVVISM